MRGVTHNDILFGRGGFTAKHPGNKKFRAMVSSMMPKYMIETRSGKSNIIDLVIVELKSTVPVSRFLQLDEQSRQYYPIDHSLARHKISQAFRDSKTYKQAHTEPRPDDIESIEPNSHSEQPDLEKTNNELFHIQPLTTVSNYSDADVSSDVETLGWIDPTESFHPTDYFSDVDPALRSPEEQATFTEENDPDHWGDFHSVSDSSQHQSDIESIDIDPGQFEPIQYEENRIHLGENQENSPPYASVTIDDQELAQTVLSALRQADEISMLDSFSPVQLDSPGREALIEQQVYDMRASGKQ